LLIAITAVIPWALYFSIHYVEGVAIPEILSALAGAAWTVIVGWKMFEAGSQPKRP
jgi:hypothetical membrane protein